ncbi:MAG: right-handed parallel beta-helix repeat-containing protein [Puniceicoccaceae bacterium]
MRSKTILYPLYVKSVPKTRLAIILGGLISIFLFSSSVSATEYHVDQSASSNTQDGSVNHPFHTIQQAADVMVAGDSCYIHHGIYREKVIPANSGTASEPITYRAFEDEYVVISGTELVYGWQVHEGSIYRAENVSMTRGDQNMLYYDASAQQLARWPNDLDGDPYTFDAYKIVTTAGTFSDSYVTHPDIPDYWSDGGVMHWLGAHSGCAVQRLITGYDPVTNRLSFTTFPSAWPFGTHSPTRWENGHRGIFYLLNHLEALDAPGEWYYDSATESLYFYAPEGVDPSSGIAEFAARDRTLDCRRNYIHFENLNFFGAPLQINGNHCQFSNIRVRHCVAGLITDESGATAGGAAVLIYGDHVRIQDSLVEEGSATGINIGMNAEFAVVENCVVRNFNTQGNHCDPIRCSGANALVTRNRIHGSARDVTRVTGNDSEFSYNHVFDGNLACADGGLFYVTGNSVPRNIELHHNWFHDAYSPEYAGKKATGIYLDNDSAGYIVHHNVVWDVKWGGLHFNWTAIENQIYNNTFWNVGEGEAQILCWVPVRNGTRTDVRDNILYNNLSDVRPWWDSGDGPYEEDETLDNDFAFNAQVADPPFVSIPERNFMLASAVPELVDQGTAVPGITDGYQGSAPDVGAYEFGGEFWIPGPDWEPDNFSWTTLEVLPPALYAQWLQELGSGYISLNADTDGDGRTNFQEYATGGHPLDPQNQGTDPVIAVLSNIVEISYSVRPEADDLNYELQGTSDLETQSWTQAQDGVISTSPNENGLTEITRQYHINDAPDFFRLIIEQR